MIIPACPNFTVICLYKINYSKACPVTVLYQIAPKSGPATYGWIDYIASY